jgi:transcriptional regulator of acetoin/glycerol metabolism
MKAGGNVSAAAQDLGISRATLHRKLARFGIQRVR